MTAPPEAGKPLDKLHVFFWILGILTAMGLALGVSVWVAHRRATAVFERHEKDVTARIAAIRARKKVPHPPIYGERIPGNGWETLSKALEGFKAIPQEDANLMPSLTEDPDNPIDPAATEAVFAKYEGLVEELRRALRHEWSNAEYRYEDGLSLLLPHISPSIRASRFLADRTNHLLGKGESGRAVDSILLALGLAQDVGRDGPIVCSLVQIVCEGIAADAWKTTLKSHDLPAKDIERLAAGLDTLQGARPDLFDAFAVESLTMRSSLVQYGIHGLPRGLMDEMDKYLPGIGWRYCFSPRLAIADALPAMERNFQKIGDLHQLPPPQWIKESQRFTDEALQDKNPIVPTFLPAMGRAVRRGVISQIDLTLMRAATAIAWYETEKGAPPASLADLVPRYLPKAPECPLTGKPFGYSPGKVWSFGVDGVDNGGKPHPEDDDEEPGYDLVWEVRRAPPAAAAPPPAK